MIYLLRTAGMATLCAMLGAWAVTGDSPAGAGAGTAQTDTAERRFALPRFDGIALEGSDDVIVRMGGAPGAVAAGDPRALAALRLEVRQGMLHVGRQRGNWQDRGAVITVNTPALRSVSLSGSGDLEAGAVASPQFEGRLSGSGDLRVAALRTQAARFRLSGSGDVSLPGLDAEALDLDLVGSGDVRAEGRARRVAIAVSGSGDVRAEGLNAHDVTIGIAGSGDVRAHADGQATIRAQGSGDVEVTGGARCTVTKNSVASVRCG